MEATFGPEGKERMLKMVAALEKALEKDIRELPWMTEATKKQALVKLAAITNKIGYPDKWRDYSAVKIDRGDLVGNVTRARSFELVRQLAKIGKPVDKGEWEMSPPTVNAYYDPQMNNINFPAGILQPPFFDNRMDDAVNFGGIGMVIGHELTHGFDDSGRQFDAEGNLKDWWTEQDGKEFEKRAACFVEEYSAFTAVGDVKVNGELTLGENAADNGGLRIAYMALMDALGDKAPAAHRRLHGRAAPLPGAGPGLVRQRLRSGGAPARVDRPPFAPEVPGQRRGRQHAGVPEGVRLQGGIADGPGQPLPRLVRGGADRRSGAATCPSRCRPGGCWLGSTSTSFGSNGSRAWRTWPCLASGKSFWAVCSLEDPFQNTGNARIFLKFAASFWLTVISKRYFPSLGVTFHLQWISGIPTPRIHWSKK